jgi:hypothetical protein
MRPILFLMLSFAAASALAQQRPPKLEPLPEPPPPPLVRDGADEPRVRIAHWMRRDATDDGVRVPMWTIWTFD